MKLVRKALAFLLVMMVVVTLPGMTSLATDVNNETTESPQNTTGDTTTDLTIEQGDSQQPAVETTVENSVAEPQTEDTKVESDLAYVYVEKPTVHVPDTENIAIALSDESQTLESATLSYTSVNSGEVHEAEATNIVGNTVLFSIDYKVGPIEDEFSLTSVTYKTADMTESTTVVFSDVQIQAGYIVTMAAGEDVEAATTKAEDTPAISVYAMNEDGATVEQVGETSDEISEVVQTVTEQADTVANGEDTDLSELDTDAGVAAESEDNGIATMSADDGISTQSNDLVVAINAGHDTGSSHNGGATGYGLNEDVLTWKVAQACVAELSKYSGVRVINVRSQLYGCPVGAGDTKSCVVGRVQAAAAQGADLFIDLHFNAGGGTGSEVYYPNGSGISGSISNMGASVANNISAQLAALGLAQRGNYGDDEFWSITTSASYGFPGLIVEHAFVDNASDAARLSNDAFLTQLGVSDAVGIANAYGLTKDPTVKISNKNDFEGTFDVNVSGVGSGANVAIWSAEGGQDDIVWTSFAGSSKTISVNIADHLNQTGTYCIHVYNLDNSKVLCTTSCKVSTDTSYSYTMDVVKRDFQYQPTIIFADMPEEVTAVSFAVWTKEDHSDLQWISSSQTAGEWRGLININDFRTAGTYTVHAYATLRDGGAIFLDGKTFDIARPSANVTIGEYDTNKGTFTVTISDIDSPSGVENIRVPIWSDVNGQDDLVWYDAILQEDGSYQTVVKISNHKYDTGIYNIHMYLTAKNGITIAIPKETEVTLPDVVISAEDPTGTESNFDLQVSNIGMFGNIKEVSFAVWSESGGQDDLIWYGANQNAATGAWKAATDISRHGSSGEYQAHAYVTLANGVVKFIGSTTFHVSPVTANVSIEKFDSNKGIFVITISDIESPSGIGRIQVPTWSDANGQDDIVWYGATAQADGTYKVTVPISNHQFDMGKYNVHTYITGKNGVTNAIPKTTEITMPNVIVSAKDSEGTEENYDLQVTNVGMFGNVAAVSFAVWSANGGQDDLVWYGTSQNKATGAWQANADISKHHSSGIYNVHAYVTLASGAVKYIGATTFEVSQVTAKIEVGKFDSNKGTFTVTIRDIVSPSGVGRIQLPIWSSVYGQDDLVWYDAILQADGSYQTVVSIANHQFDMGEYNVHTYITGKNGVTTGIAKTEEVTMPDVITSAEDSTGTEENYDLQVTNVGMFGSVAAVSFAVWSDNGGQDDLVWYGAEQNRTTGAWKATADVVRHGSAGKYNAHAYVTLKNGSVKFIGSTTFDVSPVSANISISRLDSNTGTFTITISDIKSPSGIDRILVPTWSEINGQDDIAWYAATMQTDGTYQTVVKISNHKFDMGIYDVHTYITGKNGVTSAIPKSTEITMPDVVISANDSTGTETNFDLQVSNVGMFGTVKAVSFAVWSENGGQDDLVWYGAEQNSITGAWLATAVTAKHGSYGTYEAHAYVTLQDGTVKFIGKTTYEVEKPSATVTTTNYSSTTGTFDVIISNINSKTDIDKIVVPVWTQPDQSDIVWYSATKQADSTYKVSVDPMNHKNNIGTYIIHVYMTTQSGITCVPGTATQIVNAVSLYSIMGITQTNVAQMVAYYNKKSTIAYPGATLALGGASTIEQFCQIYIEEANAEGVRAEVAFCQSMLETGFLKFGGDVQINQYNFAGLGATGGVPGNSFADVRTGIRAQIQHLKAYASKEGLNNPQVDSRFQYVSRGCAPYVQWLGVHENPYGKGWATGVNYGYNIVNLYIGVLKTF